MLKVQKSYEQNSAKDEQVRGDSVRAAQGDSRSVPGMTGAAVPRDSRGI